MDIKIDAKFILTEEFGHQGHEHPGSGKDNHLSFLHPWKVERKRIRNKTRKLGIIVIYDPN